METNKASFGERIAAPLAKWYDSQAQIAQMRNQLIFKKLLSDQKAGAGRDTSAALGMANLLSGGNMEQMYTLIGLMALAQAASGGQVDLSKLLSGETSSTGSDTSSEISTASLFAKKDCDAFSTIDSNESKTIDYDEYENYYIRDKESAANGKKLSDEDYAKYRKEALNMFNALKDENNLVTDKRYQKMLNFFDRADGSYDGKINSDYMQNAVAKIKTDGENAIISNGKTLRQLIDLEG